VLHSSSSCYCVTGELAMASGAPLLPVSAPTPPETPVKLHKRQTGGKEVPDNFYAQDVAKFVLRLERKDKRDLARLKKFTGFTENAYRFVWAYEELFPRVNPHLLTILPSGKIENDKILEPRGGKGIIAYTYSQKMHDKKTAQLYQGSPFVFEKDGEPYVMQTWPTSFNDQFKNSFTLHKYPHNPDPEHFEEEALEDFKRVVLTLFKRSGDADLPLWLGRRQSENTLPMYQGTGSELMALLRLRPDIREGLDIIKILEPDGFISKFTKKVKEVENGVEKEVEKEAEKHFHMDLARTYCLYTKQGGESMACVKPLAQFDWEATRYPADENPTAPASDEGAISFPLHMEWVSGPAYVWARKATAVVWGGAVITVTFTFFFYRRVDWFEHGPFPNFGQHLANTVTFVIILIVILFGLYADDKAMSYCIVPWLQTVVDKSCRIPLYGPVSFDKFRYFSLACTATQMLTILMNAWVLGNTVGNRDCKTSQAWQWLWENSVFGSAPLNLMHFVLFVWGLSTLQVIVPSFYTLVHISSGRDKEIPDDVDVHRPHDTQSYKLHCKSMLSGSLSIRHEVHRGRVAILPVSDKIGFMIKTAWMGVSLCEGA